MHVEDGFSEHVLDKDELDKDVLDKDVFDKDVLEEVKDGETSRTSQHLDGATGNGDFWGVVLDLWKRASGDLSVGVKAAAA